MSMIEYKNSIVIVDAVYNSARPIHLVLISFLPNTKYLGGKKKIKAMVITHDTSTIWSYTLYHALYWQSSNIRS